MSSDPTVLSYENSLLRRSDLQLLDPPNWLNDNIIAFWFEYLENEVYGHRKDALGFVCPQVVQYFKFGSPEDVRSTVQGLELDRKQFVLFPVNDCRAQTVPGGTHWSLLAYERHTFTHYDSLPCSFNTPAAEALVRTLTPFLRREGGTGAPMREGACARQTNSYDCGMHVICNAEGLSRKFVNSDPRPLTEIVPSSVVARSRDNLRNIINSLRK